MNKIKRKEKNKFLNKINLCHEMKKEIQKNIIIKLN